MRVAALGSRSVVGCAVVFVLTGCSFYKQETGYLVTRSETFTHHYVGNPCGVFNKQMCDLPEMRYTFVHRGVRTVAYCQSWDSRNKCGEIEVGKAYNCSINAATKFGGPQLSCENRVTVSVESSEQK